MNVQEHALAFACNDSWLYGILSIPENTSSRGVLVVVGGPQYRAGSHRQFTLLARDLAAYGVPVLRFDCRGMGIAKVNRAFSKILRRICNAQSTDLWKKYLVWMK